MPTTAASGTYICDGDDARDLTIISADLGGEHIQSPWPSPAIAAKSNALETRDHPTTAASKRWLLSSSHDHHLKCVEVQVSSRGGRLFVHAVKTLAEELDSLPRLDYDGLNENQANHIYPMLGKQFTAEEGWKYDVLQLSMTMGTTSFTLSFLPLPVDAPGVPGVKLADGHDARRVHLIDAELGGFWIGWYGLQAKCSKRITTDHRATPDCQRWLLHCVAHGALKVLEVVIKVINGSIYAFAERASYHQLGTHFTQPVSQEQLLYAYDNVELFNTTQCGPRGYQVWKLSYTIKTTIIITVGIITDSPQSTSSGLSLTTTSGDEIFRTVLDNDTARQSTLQDVRTTVSEEVLNIQDDQELVLVTPGADQLTQVHDTWPEERLQELAMP